jgi:hypothetical protein
MSVAAISPVSAANNSGKDIARSWFASYCSILQSVGIYGTKVRAFIERKIQIRHIRVIFCLLEVAFGD